MKTNLLNIMLGAMLVPLAAVLSCSKEQLAEPQPETGKYTITVAAGQTDGLTKTTVEGNDTDGYKAKWAADDKAGLFLLKEDGTAVEKNILMNVSKIENDGTAYFTGELTSEPVAGTVYFYYPYASTSTEIENMSRTIPTLQTPTNGKCDGKYDFMYGSAEAKLTDDGKLSVAPISMEYIVGFMNLKVAGCPDDMADDIVKKVSVAASSGKALTGSFTWSLKTGAPTVVSFSNVVAVDFSEDVKLSELDAWFCTLPFADESLTFRIVTDKHSIEKSVPVSGFNLVAGGLKRFDATVGESNGWTVSASPYAGGEITTPEAFLLFVQDVKNGSYLADKLTIGGNSYANKAPDASVENRGIDKWLDSDGVARLGNDITVTVEAMKTWGGLASVPLWTKTFDGQGHTITFEDGTLLRPIFANVFKIDENSPGIVRNLKVAGNMTSPQVPYTQGTCPLVGILHDGEVIGCQSDVNINITSYNASLDGGNIAMAGICRTMQGGKISGCTNNGNIIYKAANSGNSNQTKLVNAVYAGGIVALVGANYGGGAFGTNAPADADAPFMTSPVISGCTNKGEISLVNTATGTDYTWMQYSAAGGITAWVWGGNAIKYLTIDGCHNTASINVEQAERGNATSGITGVGGIIGRAAPTGRYGSVLGPVYGSNGITYWSGKVSECQDGFYIEVKNSDNSGRIAATSKISQPETFFHKIGCGGIAGILFGQYNGTLAKIVGCTNTGEIVGCDKAIAEEKSVAAACSQNYISGGILGYAGSVHLSDCHQIGGIGQNGYNLAVGGIMGAAYNKFVVENCTVKADLFRYMPTTVSKDVFAALITNYMYTSGKGWTREANYNMYEGSEIKGCAVAGSVKYTKGTASGTARTDEQIKSSSDVNSLTYCALSNSDMASSIGNNAGGKITISGTTRYTE
ncbi:MAG: fimbrillin family protein [Candidatus Cryptobacteroides sp.]|nr:fimbrillin family protein [Bacteroidales bacterium]MDY2773534.1 fimbrillin family protein [Candidatus Cryptobacteroides sp.]